MSRTARKLEPRSRTARRYQEFQQIDGSHPFKDAVPFGYVDYEVRVRPNGKVAYFNFDLAKEMGLIPPDHPNSLTDDLRSAVIDTFGLVIINEHDFISGKSIPEQEIKPNRYMATRYLQLQHPSRVGKTSGDGRSIWNGFFRGRGQTWDISSCGTGATCLSPARAKSGKFYRTGDPSVSYGCGFAELSEGITNAVFSEILHRNQIATERTLAVIEYPKGSSVVVRAHPNLLRPSHFFNHLRQGRYDRLKGAVDLFIERQINNRKWKNPPKEGKLRYEYALVQLSQTFAKMAAVFEREYIFCWLDWDGDNILADGSIIDYGSIRRFGLFHHEYRYDDVERWSTNIKEQREKARLIVQTFAQMFHYLITGNRRPLHDFRNHLCLKDFDRNFAEWRSRILLTKIGFDEAQTDFLMRNHLLKVRAFEQNFDHFERVKSSKGRERVEDGVNWNAVFNLRNLLARLPHRIIEQKGPIRAKEFIQLMKSAHASRRDCQLTRVRLRRVDEFQSLYLQLMSIVGKSAGKSLDDILEYIRPRAQQINRSDRMTGNAMIYVGDWLVRKRKQLSDEEYQSLVRKLIDEQTLTPVDGKRRPTQKVVDLTHARWLRDAKRMIIENSEGL
jgi:uncharacterized protein YdiU (UPF0061 family)